MILLIRIAGAASQKRHVEETLRRLNMHRKLAATLIDSKDEVRMGMLKASVEFVAYGEISDELMTKLIVKRGQTLTGKPISEKEAGKVVQDIKNGEWKIKKFFRLHPPRGGFKKSTKVNYPKGVLGENKEIAKLLERML